MGTRTAPQDRSPDARVREFLEAGDTRRAVHAARDLVEKVLAALRDGDPSPAALLGAAVAGHLVEIAAVLPSRKAPKVPGYRGGPPSAAHLIAAYEAARAETARQQ